MLRRLMVVLLGLAAVLAFGQGGMVGNVAVSSGNVAANPDLAGVSFEPKIGATPPMDVPLTDDAGHATNPGRLLRGRPIVLLPVFYRCAGVCSTEIQGVIGALRNNPKLMPGRDLDLVILGLNPKETPALAKAKKTEYLQEYGHPETKAGWTFLTAPMAETTKVANALGVHYTYDPVKDQVNHPSAILVLTPTGRVSAVMTQGMYPAAQFAADVARAAKDELGEAPSDTSWLGCVHTDPVTGRRSLVIQGVMRLFAVVVVLGILATMTLLGLRNRRPSVNT